MTNFLFYVRILRSDQKRKVQKLVMERKGVLSTLKFIAFSMLSLALIFSAVVFTIFNTYKPAVKTYINGECIGYFSSEQQFDEVYNQLVTEKQNIDPNVKAYLESEPTFETSYVKDSLLEQQNVYTNLRAQVKTEYTIYNVAVDGENKMTFNTKDEALTYAESLKSQVSKLNTQINEARVEELGEITTIERADAILKDIVDRNKPVTTPKATTAPKKKATNNTNNNVKTIGATSVQATGAGVWPTVARRINCHWMGYAGHTGTDIGGAIGTAIYAFRTGTVIFAGWSSGYGNTVRIDHGGGVSTLYAHASQLLVKTGQRVSEGQMIAKIGMTGYTTGPHLHFEVRINGVPVNAYPYIAGK